MRDDVLPRGEQIEHAAVVDAVVDARALAPRLDHTDPAKGAQVLRGAARVELELGLQPADRPLAVAQQLEDADARWMAEHPEERRLDLVHGAG